MESFDLSEPRGLTLAASPAAWRALALAQESTEPPLRAKLRIHPEVRLGKIDPFLNGHSLEHACKKESTTRLPRFPTARATAKTSWKQRAGFV